MDIHVITEGATEREVGKILHQRTLLSKEGVPKLPKWKSVVEGNREGYENVVMALSGREGVLESLRTNSAERQRILLLFDQEEALSPEERCRKIQADLRWSDPEQFWKTFAFTSIADWPNLFEHRSDRLHILLHIADVAVIGIRRADFDGYLLQLLQGPANEQIAEKLLPKELANQESINRLLQKGEVEFTKLMQSNGYPWTHAKSWLYAYITAFQCGQSHVWLARDVVKVAPDDELRRVFASLIASWDRLVAEDRYTA